MGTNFGIVDQNCQAGNTVQGVETEHITVNSAAYMNKNVFHDSSKNRSELKSANRTNFVGFTRICWETSDRQLSRLSHSFTRKKNPYL